MMVGRKVELIIVIRRRVIIKKNVNYYINTWRPWNPVATKNVDPYIESAIPAKDDSIPRARARYRIII